MMKLTNRNTSGSIILSVRISRDEMAHVEKLAENANLTKANFVRACINHWEKTKENKGE